MSKLKTALLPIETVAIGDFVWARDPETGVTELKPVTHLFAHERVIWEVELIGENGAAEFFETTDDHPWWIVAADGSGAWVLTCDLATGMTVVSRTDTGPDRFMTIASVEATSRQDLTYNFTVADFHTYFVGENRVLVHNCNRRGRDFTRAQRRDALQANRDANGGNLTCERCGRDDLVSGQRSQSGVRTPDNQAQVHHNPSIQNGGGRHSRAEVMCPSCHKEAHRVERAAREQDQ